MKSFNLMALLATVSVAHAEIPPPPTATSLPAIDVLCFRSFVASTLDFVPGVVIDEGYGGEPRFQLLTVDGKVLKVITNPSLPALRSEYGRSAFQINISMVIDPAKRPPIFAWQMDKDTFAYRSDDKLLSISRTYQGSKNMGVITTTEVLKCK